MSCEQRWGQRVDEDERADTAQHSTFYQGMAGACVDGTRE